MVSLGAQFALILGGLMAVFLVDWIRPLCELPWWSAAVLFLLPLLSRRPLVGRYKMRAALVLLSPLAVELGFLFLTDWARVAKSWSPLPAIPGWPGLETLLALLPLAISHALVSAQPGEPFLRSLVSGQNVRARLALFIWIVLSGYLVFSGALAQSTTLRVWVEESTPASFAFSLVALAGVLVLVPRLLLALLDTVPIEGYERSLAEELSAKLGVRPPRLLEWRTDGEITNAMVLAMPFGPRPVLFTDAFRRQLSISEFRGVLAHELGHVAGKHVGLFASFVLGTAMVVEATLGGRLEGSFGELYALVFLLVLALMVGFISRRLELEADLFALEATGDRGGLSMALMRAGGYRVRKKNWRHFSTARRLIFLRAAEHDVGARQRLRSDLKKLRVVSWALLIAGTLALGVDSVQSWPTERFWIDVRTTNPEAAIERLEALNTQERARVVGADELSSIGQARLRLLLQVAANLQAEGQVLTTANLCTLASEQHALGNEERVSTLIDLAFLIADPSASQLATALERGGQLTGELASWEPVLKSLTQTP